jgi:hypothetical protein
MPDLDADCFTLRQANAAREDYAQLMEELELVNCSWPGSRHGETWRKTALFISFTAAALVISWFEAFSRHCL